MSAFSRDLLQASARLLGRRSGQKGPIRSAYVGRSISTSYYAIFHFLTDEAACEIVGASRDLQRRRRTFVRTFSHASLTTAFGKLRGTSIDPSIADLFRSTSGVGPLPTPAFVRLMAATYLDAKAQREDADYNLNESLTARDAELLRQGVAHAIETWESAIAASDRDAKRAVAALLTAKGQLRTA